jgi:hypothetical protein
MLMRSSARVITAAIAVTLPAHLLLFLSSETAMAALLVYVGIALPAVWSDKPARRKAAAAVLRQILTARTDAHLREMPARTPNAEDARSSGTRWSLSPTTPMSRRCCGWPLPGTSRWHATGPARTS